MFWLALLSCVFAASAEPAPDFDGGTGAGFAQFKAIGHFELRSPTMEHFALRNPEFLADPGLPLLPEERKDAEEIFGASLDLDAVRVATVRLKAIPCMTFGNVIRLAPGAYDRATLIHELVHVWQFQTGGGAYLSRAVVEHAAGGPYDYTLVAGKRLSDYAVEQQAEIVEDWFRGANGRRWDAWYIALVAQLKERRPVFRSNAAALEESAGLGSDRILPPQQRGNWPKNPFDDSGLVPQLELRFPTPF